MIGTLRRAPGGKVGRAAVIAAVAAAAMLAPAAAWAHVTVDRTQPNGDGKASDGQVAAELTDRDHTGGPDSLEELAEVGVLLGNLGVDRREAILLAQMLGILLRGGSTDLPMPRGNDSFEGGSGTRGIAGIGRHGEEPGRSVSG